MSDDRPAVAGARVGGISLAEHRKAYEEGAERARVDVAAGVNLTADEVRALAAGAYARLELAKTWKDGYIVARAAALDPDPPPPPRV